MNNNRVIKILIEDGAATIEDKIPEGIIVMVIDYDIEGADESRLSKDSKGKSCLVSIYDSSNNKYKQF